MSEYTVHPSNLSRLPEWEVFKGAEWLATFGSKADAELFIKIKQINEILST